MSTYFPHVLMNAADDAGTIRWSVAVQVAKDHSLWEDFIDEYGSNPFRIDAGEFLQWLGY